MLLKNEPGKGDIPDVITEADFGATASAGTGFGSVTGELSIGICSSSSSSSTGVFNAATACLVFLGVAGTSSVTTNQY